MKKLKRRMCLICDRQTYEHINICPDCHSLLDKKNERVIRNFSYVDEAHACFYYNDFLRNLISRYKFGNKRYFSFLFAELMIEKIFSMKLHRRVDYMISVPLHTRSLIKRGFNQIEEIEDEILKLISIPTSKNNLIKIRQTEEQARLNEISRLENLRDAFSLKRPLEIQDKNILLIDDMITTGATLDECSKVLKRSGAREVVVLTLATSK